MSKAKKSNGHHKSDKSKYHNDRLAVNATFEEMVKIAVTTPPSKSDKKEKEDLK